MKKYHIKIRNILLLLVAVFSLYAIYFFLMDCKYSKSSVATEMVLPYLTSNLEKLDVSNNCDAISKVKIERNVTEHIHYRLTVDDKIFLLRNETMDITIIVIPEIEKTDAGEFRKYKCYGFPASEMRIANCENYLPKEYR